MKNQLIKPREEYKTLPENPGVYLMKDAAGRLLYIGKAANLRRRVSSYFTRPHDIRIERMVASIDSLEFRETETPIEALILEAELIHEHKPPFNVIGKDGKSFLYVEITDEQFPRVLLVRDTNPVHGERFGPFTSSTSIREAMKIIRRLFPYNLHSPEKVGTFKRPCFEYEVHLCPGTCINAISEEQYKKNVRNVKLFLQGKKQQIIKELTRDMKLASGAEDFELAQFYKQKLFAVQHIRDIALIHDSAMEIQGELVGPRIEGYDISHISGTNAVGSMVVFYGMAPKKSDYRKFKIKTVEGSNDTAMLKEVLSRRLKNSWPLPACIMVDGGGAQVHAMEAVIHTANLSIPVVGIAKGPERKRNDVIGILPEGVTAEMLVAARDEAHRFAIAYHRTLRSKF